MAIQIPNLGTGNGQTGDNEFVIRQKYNSNFSNQAHAASREVGTKNGNVPIFHSQGLSGAGYAGSEAQSKSWQDKTLPTGFYRGVDNLDPESPLRTWSSRMVLRFSSTDAAEIAVATLTGEMAVRGYRADSSSGWAKVYTSGNTMLDGNGSLKPSSPVLRVFADRVEGNADADKMAATYTKNGVGDYTITGTTGLRTDGWYIVIPNDMNGNPLVAIGTLDDTDGVITLKTYVRIFDMSTFKFVPDLEQPLDIPDGRWIDLRFNDLPVDESAEV